MVCRRIKYEEGDTFEAMIDEDRFNDLTIFGLRSIFEYGFVENPDKAILKLLRHGVRPILAVAEKYRPVKTVVIALSGSMESARATRDYLQLDPWPGAKSAWSISPSEKTGTVPARKSRGLLPVPWI